LPEPAEALHRAANKAVHAVSLDIEALRFNRAVAHIYEFANTMTAAKQTLADNGDKGLAWALRYAADCFVHMFAPMMPHLGEECWQRLGHDTLLAEQSWPAVDESLLVDDSVTIAVQVNGKRRDQLTIARDARKEDIESAALKLDNVVRAIGGRDIKKIIVVPQRIVNVVA
jgi:leucyl-tRNA synthetase